MPQLLALWRVRSVLLMGALLILVLLWRGERAGRIEAEADLATALRGEEIAAEVRERNAARAEEIGRALAEAWKENPDAADAPVDPALLDAVRRVRAATRDGPR